MIAPHEARAWDTPSLDLRSEIWLDFAEHFLDTETRQLIPASAARCVQAGLSVEEASAIWRFEVAPAVWGNLYSVAGEWAGWDRDWLIARIQGSRSYLLNRPGWLSNLVYRVRVHFNHGVWLAIAACMKLLKGAPESERTELVAALTWLASHYFELMPGDRPSLDVHALTRLYCERFLVIFEPLVVTDSKRTESKTACAARVNAALKALRDS